MALWQWPWDAAAGRAARYAEAAQRYADEANAAHRKALQCALAAGEAAAVAAGGGVGDGEGRGLDDDLETLDTHTLRGRR